MWVEAVCAGFGGAMTRPEFLIEMDRLHNLREVAGYATASGVMRAGRLYRSGAWELMSEADHRWFGEAIETVVEEPSLRSALRQSLTRDKVDLRGTLERAGREDLYDELVSKSAAGQWFAGFTIMKYPPKHVNFI